MLMLVSVWASASPHPLKVRSPFFHHPVTWNEVVPGKKPPDAFAIVEVSEDLIKDGKIDRDAIKQKYRGTKWATREPDIGMEEMIQ